MGNYTSRSFQGCWRCLSEHSVGCDVCWLLLLFCCRQTLNNCKTIIIKSLILRSRVQQLRNKWWCFSCGSCFAKKVLNTLVLDSTIIIIKLKLAFRQMSPRVKIWQEVVCTFSKIDIFFCLVSAPYRDREMLAPTDISRQQQLYRKMWGPALLLTWWPWASPLRLEF